MSPKLFDTHTHFNFNAFKDDSEEVMQRTLEEDVWFINVGAEARTSERAMKMTEKYPQGVYASVGLHPIHTYDDKLAEVVNGEKVEFVTKAENFDPQFYENLIKSSDKVVAVGETGLDYFHIRKFDPVLQEELRQKQKEIFALQIDLAFRNNKPLILHCRPTENYNAYVDLLAILKENKDKLLDNPGVIHCFSANLEIMRGFLEMGFCLGFNGIITFTSAYDNLVQEAPLSKILLETDSPWLAPVPFRGKRNESIYVQEVAKKIGELKKMSFEEVAEATTENTKRVFGIE